MLHHMNPFSSESKPSEEPLYNIGLVSRMTGIPVATLRVWERRYGFPDSTRTPGGHRLCSEKEVLRLRWVKARVDEGMQTGQAIRALQHLEREGRFPDAPFASLSQPPAPPVDPSFPVFRERLAEVLMAHDTQQADRLLGQLLSLYSIEDLVLEVVGPALDAIGQAWHDGAISIATEHLASNFLRQHLLMWMSTGPIPFAGVAPTILACAPEEWHEGSLLMLGVLLRRLRWPVAYLGQSVPLSDLGALARQIRAPAVVLVAMTEVPARALAEWPQHLPETIQGNKLIVGFGGMAFNHKPELRELIPGVFLGETLREGAQKLDHLLRATVHPSV
ncbi:MAG: MerR family DNA-binding transcriptional regulator [Chloroflexi bacterium]|nr:MerR family DNA-binding transcriptional regulator [Chloroflexota bacterium]